jgi:hypothetical protein
VTDGPFIESKEVIGGYGILQAKSKEEAIELGKGFMKMHMDVLGLPMKESWKFGRCPTEPSYSKSGWDVWC